MAILNPKELRIFGVSNCDVSLLTDKNFPLYVDLGYNTALMSTLQKEYVNEIRNHVAIQHKKAKELQCTLRRKCEEAANISHSYALQKQSSLTVSDLHITKPVPVKPYLCFNYSEAPKASLVADYFGDSEDNFPALLDKISERQSVSPNIIRDGWSVKRKLSPEKQLELPKLGYTRLQGSSNRRFENGPVQSLHSTSTGLKLPSLCRSILQKRPKQNWS